MDIKDAVKLIAGAVIGGVGIGFLNTKICKWLTKTYGR